MLITCLGLLIPLVIFLSSRHGASSGCGWRRRPPDMDRGLWIYWLSSHRQPTRYCPPAWGWGEGQTIPHLKKQLIMKCWQDLGFGRILCDCVRNETRIWDLEHGNLVTGSLKNCSKRSGKV